MTAPEDPTTVLPAVRICAGCGEGFQPRRRGRPGRYCRPACRQRAWALRRAEAELLAEGVDLAGRGEVGADRRGADRRGADRRGADRRGADRRGADRRGADSGGAVPAGGAEWGALLGALEAQLRDPGSDLARRPWEHVQIYDALGRALAALAATTPGGLDWLDRHDQGR